MSRVLQGLDGSGSFRVYITDATDLVRQAQAIHNTSPLATAALGRVLTGAGLMSILLKNETDRMTVIFKGDGPAQQIVAVGEGNGQVKGYIANPDVDLPLREDGHLDVGGALGIGDLTVIKDLGLKEPWSGNIALVSGEIAEDLTAYYFISEQANTSIALGVRLGTDGLVEAAGGFFIQMLPDAEEGAIEALEALLGQVEPITEITRRAREQVLGEKAAQANLEQEDEALQEQIVTLMRDEIFQGIPQEYSPKTQSFRDIQWHCGCSKERMQRALMTIGVKDLRSLLQEDGGAELSCQFCGNRFQFDRQDLTDMIAALVMARK